MQKQLVDIHFFGFKSEQDQHYDGTEGNFANPDRYYLPNVTH